MDEVDLFFRADAGIEECHELAGGDYDCGSNPVTITHPGRAGSLELSRPEIYLGGVGISCHPAGEPPGRRIMTHLLRVLFFLALFSGVSLAAQPESSSLVVSVAEWPTIFASRSKTTGETMVPGIEIYSDGTTIIKPRNGHEIAKRIDAQRFRELFEFLRDQHLFDVTDVKITDAIRRAVPLPPPTDQPRTILFAATEDQKVTIVQYAFPFFAEKFPRVDSLQIMDRCIAKIYETVNEPRN